MNWMNNPQPMPPQPQPQPLRRINGRWQEIGSYQEMQAIPLPFDGTPILFVLANEPVVYMASMQNGQKCVSGFRLEPISIDEGQRQTSSVEQRLSSLEGQINKLLTVLGEGVENEPDSATIPKE